MNQTTMQQQIDRLVARELEVQGQATSLLDVGYRSVEEDDGWEACGQGKPAMAHHQSMLKHV
jgi:hypothetical protein